MSIEEVTNTVSESGEKIEYSVKAVSEDGETGLRKVRVNIIDKDTGEPIEEVDVYTSADAVTFADNRTLPQELDYIMKYTNSNKMPSTLGGLSAGTSFSEKPIKDILTELLYPYVKPNIGLSSSATNSYYEKGINISPITITLKVEKTSENITNAVLYKDGLKLSDFQNISSEGGIDSYKYTGSIASSTKFVAKVTDTKGNTYDTNTISLVFNDPIYIGCVASNINIDQGVIKTLSKIINYSNANNININKKLSPTEECFLIAYKSYSGDSEKVTIYDTNGYNITASFEKSKISITNAAGESVSYTVLKSNPTSQTDFNINLVITN